MSERISFFKNKSFIILHNTEEVSEGANLLRSFFWIFTGHGEPEDHARYRSEFASFYSARVPRLSELHKEGFEIEKVEFTTKKDVPDIFFDERDLSLNLTDIPRQRVVCLFVNGQRAGVYFTKNRVLVATDWTHNSRCIETLKEILPALSKIFRRKSSKPPKPRVRITFGADPEFELIRSGKILSASGVIAGGTDSSELIGRDGAGSQVEIRPAPSSNLRQFIENFRKGLIEFSKMYPGYSLSAQGDVYPLGGHIHISVSPNIEIIRLLDNWLGKRVIDLSGRARGSYRKMGAIETKPWGFEYRTPPAAIFLRRDVLYAILRIIKEVIKAYYSMDGVCLEPSKEEIERLQLKEEWQTLNNFIEEYESLDKDVLRQWGVRRYKPKPRVDLVFRDDWASEIRSYVSSLLSERLGKLAKKLNTRGIYTVILFGFRSERGMVCNFESTVFEKIDFDYSVNSGEKAFGLPYDIRVAELNDDVKKMWEVVVEEIIESLLK
jgi:hypothetical protein